LLRPLHVVVLLALVSVPARTAPADPDVTRVAAAAAAYEDALVRWKSGSAPLDDLYRWSIRWNDAAHDPRAHAARMTILATAVKERVASGVASASDTKAVDYYVAEAAVLAR
jgi:hypothetical protein